MNQYDFIPELSWTSGKFSLFNKNWLGLGNKWASGGIKPGVAQVFPGVFQGTREFNNAKFELSQLLQERWDGLSPSVDNSLGYYQILTDFGYPADLAPYALNDVSVTRSQYKLRNPTVEELDLFRTYVRTILHKGKLVRILHSKVSSVGAKSFVIGSEFRKEAANWLLTPTHLSLLSKKVVDWDVSWMSEMHFYPLYTQGTRKHVVKCTRRDGKTIALKERRYIKTEDILDHSYQLSNVRFEHPVDPRMLCYDIRSMYAAPALPNLINQIVNNFVTAGLKEFACFKYEGEQQLAKALKGKISKGGRLLSLDKSKFGDTFCPALIQIFVEELEYVGFVPDVINIVREMLEWPTYFRTVERDNNVPIQTRAFTPVKELDRFKATFKSGNGLVSCIGQLIGGFDAVLKARSLFGTELVIEKFLNNEYNDLFMHNKGDDTLWWFGPRYVSKSDDFSSSLHKDEVEVFPLYLGYLYDQDGNVHTDISRWLVNTWCHERSMKAKRMPREGFRARFDLYKNNPFFSDAFELSCKVMRENLGFDFELFLNEPDPIVEKSFSFENLNPLEKEFLANPDLAFYKEGLLEEVRPEIQAIFFTGTNPEKFSFLLKGD